MKQKLFVDESDISFSSPQAMWALNRYFRLFNNQDQRWINAHRLFIENYLKKGWLSKAINENGPFAAHWIALALSDNGKGHENQILKISLQKGINQPSSITEQACFVFDSWMADGVSHDSSQESLIDYS